MFFNLSLIKIELGKSGHAFLFKACRLPPFLAVRPPVVIVSRNQWTLDQSSLLIIPLDVMVRENAITVTSLFVLLQWDISPTLA